MALIIMAAGWAVLLLMLHDLTGALNPSRIRTCAKSIVLVATVWFAVCLVFLER